MLFDTVLWASDGRAEEHQLVRYVAELCERYCSQLWIVHVVQTIVPEPVPLIDLHGGEEQVIDGLKARTRALRLQGVDASLQVIRGVVGSPAPAIAQLAEAVAADLIVLHPHERRTTGPIRTAARLLVTSPCPLLLLGCLPNGSRPPTLVPPPTDQTEPRNTCLTEMQMKPSRNAAAALRY